MTTLQALITNLGSAEEGSRDIEIELHEAVHGKPPDGLRWGDIPLYTRSLDASLPGENIVHVYHDRIRAFWQATHEGPDWLTDTYVGIAKTEATARRLACLKAMADE